MVTMLAGVDGAEEAQAGAAFQISLWMICQLKHCRTAEDVAAGVKALQQYLDMIGAPAV